MPRCCAAGLFYAITRPSLSSIEIVCVNIYLLVVLFHGASFVQELHCNIFRSVHTSPLAACRKAWSGKNSREITVAMKIREVFITKDDQGNNLPIKKIW